MPTIAVDAMGGDLGPTEVVRAVAAASLETEIECVLVGDEAQVQAILDTVSYNPELISIQHTPEWIGMGEDPKTAVRHKRDASVAVGARLVAAGQADALVTAGNTGAAVIACAHHFTLLRGVRKAALASVYPRQTEYPGQDQLALLLDVGATIHCDHHELVQFAQMGHAYARVISRVPSPRVALLNMGTEAGKGGEALVHAHRQLQQLSGINFVGNIEGSDLAKGRADVIVCEGLLGNVVLKMFEGVAEVLLELTGTLRAENWREKLGLRMLEGSLKRLRELTDYTAYGGAPFLGFEQLLIKAHGRSNARAVKNAIKVAAKAARDGVTREVAAAIGQR
jgi:glycerol-3-phosphate acyltransferase PlsX